MCYFSRSLALSLSLYLSISAFILFLTSFFLVRSLSRLLLYLCCSHRHVHNTRFNINTFANTTRAPTRCQRRELDGRKACTANRRMDRRTYIPPHSVKSRRQVCVCVCVCVPQILNNKCDYPRGSLNFPMDAFSLTLTLYAFSALQEDSAGSCSVASRGHWRRLGGGGHHQGLPVCRRRSVPRCYPQQGYHERYQCRKCGQIYCAHCRVLIPLIRSHFESTSDI